MQGVRRVYMIVIGSSSWLLCKWIRRGVVRDAEPDCFVSLIIDNLVVQEHYAARVRGAIHGERRRGRLLMLGPTGPVTVQ